MVGVRGVRMLLLRWQKPATPRIGADMQHSRWS